MEKLICTGLLLLLAIDFASGSGNEYAGSAACKNCHQAEYDRWSKSHHYLAMLPADEDSVRGLFDGSSLEFHGVPSVLTKRGDVFEVETSTDKGREIIQIAYTFGAYPLQQYLVERERGKLQALNIAWDDRPSASGGQRWYHLREKLDDDSPFFWTRHLQNWNAGCAECHSTGVAINYDRRQKSYQTNFSDVNVGCEACHGPGQNHIETASSGNPSALVNLGQGMQWSYAANDQIASGKGLRDDSYLGMCGGCHSRRRIIGEINPGQDFREQYQISFLEEGLYYPDGQIQDEVFVLGSFMQSRMYQSGVTCMNCHDAHDGKIKIKGDGLCAQCHSPKVFDQISHAGHTREQAKCVDCHMPERIYMGIDARRDHQFGIPDPHLAESLGVPHACANCHADQPIEWAKSQTKARANDYAYLTAAVRKFDPSQISSAQEYIADAVNPMIRRATLLAGLPPTREAMRLAIMSLQDTSPMMREAASRLLISAPEELRYQVLSDHASDPDKSVRLNVGKALAPLLTQLPLEEARSLLPTVTELTDSLRVDRVADLTTLASIQLQIGQRGFAEEIYKEALGMEPHYLPALLNLADLKREDDESESLALLQRAVQQAPDSGAALHSFGLALVRAKRTEEAVHYLGLAFYQSDAIPRYAYVYAVALESTGEVEEALSVLANALERWPNQPDLFALKAAYRPTFP